jgi:hypothetical protein
MSIEPYDGITEDTPLWRYMELSKFMMLLAGKVFIPTVSTLKKDADPKEAGLPSHSELDLPELLFEGKPGEEPKPAQGFRIWLARRGEESRAGTGRTTPESNQASSATADPRSSNATLYDVWLKHLSARRAVWCWGSTRDLRSNQEPWQNLAMWNSYARSGVTIKTTFQNVKEAVIASGDMKAADGVALKLRYFWQGDDIPELFDDDGRLKRPFRPFAFKNKSYKFESEVRIVFRINCQRDSPAGLVVDIDPSVLLDGGEVVVSPYLQQNEAHALVALIKWLLNNESITVRRSTERQEAGPEIDAWIRALHGPYPFQRRLRQAQDAGGVAADSGSPNQWLHRFESEDGLPHLLQEL